MKLRQRLALMALISVPVSMATALPAVAAVPAPDDVFTFDDSMVASNGVTTLLPYDACPQGGTGPCNASSGFGSEDGDGYWEWASTDVRFGGGFLYNPSTDIGDTYTFFLRFKITEPSSSSYNKLVDYLDRVDDTGFYLYDGSISFYDLGYGAETLDDTQILDLAVVRDSSVTPATFSVYTRDGSGLFTRQLVVDDPDEQSIAFLDGSGHSKLGFFNNDELYNEGIQGGRVYDLRFWYNTALTEDQLNEFVTPAEPTSQPETPALATTGSAVDSSAVVVFTLMATGAALVAVRRRQARFSRSVVRS